MGEKITFNALQTNPNGTKAEVEISFSPYELSRNLKEEQFSELLDNWLNNFNGDFSKGQRIARHLFYTHPTLQGSVIRFALGILAGFAEKVDFIDARNETPIEMCKKIKHLLDNGELNKGYMI